MTGICLPATRVGDQDTWNEAVIGPDTVPQSLKQSARYVSRPDIPPRNVVCSLQRKQSVIPNQKKKNRTAPGINAVSVLGSKNDVLNGADKCDIFQ